MLKYAVLDFRQMVGLLVALLALAVAVLAAFATGGTPGAVVMGVEILSGSGSGLLGGLANALPVGYAFGAGMVAAVNPCGFALLPAYLALYLGNAEASNQGAAVSRMSRAFAVSGTVTLGFILLFGVAGVVLAVAASAVASFFPWVGLAIGVGLVVVGGRMLSGAPLYTDLGERLAERIGTGAGSANVRGYLAYGLAYGAASLSCTLPIFLTVVGSALTVQGFLAAALQFVLYGLGMGLVITLLTLGTAVFKAAAVARARRLVAYVGPATSLLSVLAGTYIVYYWLTLGGLLSLVL